MEQATVIENQIEVLDLNKTKFPLKYVLPRFCSTYQGHRVSKITGTQMRPQDFAEHFLQSFFNPGNSFAPGTNPYGGYGGGFQFSWN